MEAVSSVSKLQSLSRIGTSLCNMERPLLNLIQKQAPKRLDPSLSNPLPPILLSPAFTRNVLEKIVATQLIKHKEARLMSFIDYQGFSKWLGHKTQFRPAFQTGYFLSSKVNSRMLPAGSLLSAFLPEMLPKFRTMTDPANLTLNNPFKTVQNVQAAASLGVKNMVVNTPDQIQKLERTGYKVNYHWEFDQIDFNENETVLRLLADQKLLLKGLRFKDMPLTKMPEIQKLIQLGIQLGHNLEQNTIALELEQLVEFKELRKVPRVVPEITNLDCSDFVVCAAKVIGKNRYNRIYPDKAQQIISPAMEGIHSSTLASEWTFFKPSKCFRLDEISDSVVNINT